MVVKFIVDAYAFGEGGDKMFYNPSLYRCFNAAGFIWLADTKVILTKGGLRVAGWFKGEIRLRRKNYRSSAWLTWVARCGLSCRGTCDRKLLTISREKNTESGRVVNADEYYDVWPERGICVRTFVRPRRICPLREWRKCMLYDREGWTLPVTPAPGHSLRKVPI